jgi:hypothetical protein
LDRMKSRKSSRPAAAGDKLPFNNSQLSAFHAVP